MTWIEKEIVIPADGKLPPLRATAAPARALVR